MRYQAALLSVAKKFLGESSLAGKRKCINLC
jgi:hypothetical protein